MVQNRPSPAPDNKDRTISNKRLDCVVNHNGFRNWNANQTFPNTAGTCCIAGQCIYVVQCAAAHKAMRWQALLFLRLPMQILLIMWIWQATQKPGSVQQHRHSVPIFFSI
jgi:hypothetical protein